MLLARHEHGTQLEILWSMPPQHVAQIAGTTPLPVPVPPLPASDQPDENQKKTPQLLVRTCLSSLANTKAFGLQMQREARRRCLDKAPYRAFVGDGLPANWTIWKKHFRDFEPIPDFMHAVEYVYAAAVVITRRTHRPPGNVTCSGQDSAGPAG